MMDSLSPKALFRISLFLLVAANAQSVSVSGITKRKILTQSSASSAALKGYQIRSFIDGSLIFSGNQETLINYDVDPEDPTVYRDEATFNFNGTNSIPVEFREYEDGKLYDSFEITFNIGG